MPPIQRPGPRTRPDEIDHLASLDLLVAHVARQMPRRPVSMPAIRKRYRTFFRLLLIGRCYRLFFSHRSPTAIIPWNVLPQLFSHDLQSSNSASMLCCPRILSCLSRSQQLPYLAQRELHVQVSHANLPRILSPLVHSTPHCLSLTNIRVDVAPADASNYRDDLASMPARRNARPASDRCAIAAAIPAPPSPILVRYTSRSAATSHRTATRSTCWSFRTPPGCPGRTADGHVTENPVP